MNSYLYYSFYITCSFLVTTGTITFIEALRTDIVPMRHILNLETCISIVAAYFYGKFIEMIDSSIEETKETKETKETNENNENKKIEESQKVESELQRKINITRYVDWMITTPIMLLVLILALRFNIGKTGVKLMDYVVILILNYAMLGVGYLGEVGTLDRIIANLIGFVFFAGLYGYIYWRYMRNNKGELTNNMTNKLLYLAFFILWSFYGIFYQMKDEAKNMGYNVLDLFSKCFVGIYFWSCSSNIFL